MPNRQGAERLKRGDTIMSDLHSTRSLREIARIIFQHWFMLLFIVLVGGGGTYALCQWATPVYESKVSVIFKRPADKSPLTAAPGDRALEVFVKAQQQIVMSDLVLARTMIIAEDQKLRDKWFKMRDRWHRAEVEGGEALATARAEIAQFVGKEVEPGVGRLLSTGQKDLKTLRDAVKLETPGGEQVALTESFTIAVRRPGPPDQADSYKRAMYAADLLADMYMLRYQELQEDLSNPGIRVMQEVVDAYEKESADVVGAYQKFVKEHSDEVGVLEQLLKSGTEHGTQVVLTKVREDDAVLALELARDTAVYNVLKGALPAKALEPGGIDAMTEDEVEAAAACVPAEFLRENVGFTEFVKDAAKLEARCSKLEAQFTENSRNVQYAREEVVLAKRRLLQAIVAHEQGLEASIKARQEQKQTHEELVKSLAAEQNQTQAKLATYAELKNNFQVVQKHLEKLQQDKLEALSNWLQARNVVTITKLDVASLPAVDRPVMPRPLLYTLVALAVSILVGVAGAFLVDHFDHTLRSIDEAERYLGLPVVGSIKRRGRRLIIET
jgi:capsular polysaccharide biosynthesis protein